MKLLTYFKAGLLMAAAGVFSTSCTSEIDQPSMGVDPGKLLLRSPQIVAWSGSTTLGLGSRSVETEYYEVMPDYTAWCDGWWPAQVPQTSPAIPADAIEVNSANWYNIKFESGKTYVLEGILNGFGDGLSAYEGIFLNEIPADVTIYVNGAWALFGATDNSGLTPGQYPSIIVCENSELVIKDYEEELVKLDHINIFNYGSTILYYNHDEPLGEGCTIYDTKHLVFEQNYIDDNDDLSLDPIVVNRPIYSTGEVFFRGGVQFHTDDTYFRKVCVDGQTTVENGYTIHTGYLNTDELYLHDNAVVETAPEGMIVSGTISARDGGMIKGDGTANGFILTNEIIGENKTNGTVGTKMESTINEGNFASVFRNVDIYVTKTINNYQKTDVIEKYQPANGTTYALDTTEFDASENDDFVDNDVNCFGCGIGYRYVRKSTPEEPGEEPETPEVPDTPTTPDTPDTPEGDVVLSHNNEVEINLSLNDSHEQYTEEDLISKLSIHVRYPGDVEVFIPVPRGYYCEADDMNLVEHGLYLEPQPETRTYEIGGHIVTLTVTFEEGGIRVTTDGINQEVLDYCYEHYNDGLNFEVYNYFGLYEQDASGNWVRAEGERGNLARETVLGFLNQATVTFLDNPGPDYYINAFGYDYVDGTNGQHTDAVNPDDCYVKPTDSGYTYEGRGGHLNDTPYNDIYNAPGVTDSHIHE